MPDSLSSEPVFESPLATVSNIGHFRSLYWRPSWLSCINEYLAIDNGGNVSNCCMTRMLPGETELVSEWTGLPGRTTSVKRFERSYGLDTALYKNYLYLCYLYTGLLFLFFLPIFLFTSVYCRLVSSLFFCSFSMPLFCQHILASCIFAFRERHWPFPNRWKYIH